MYRAVTWIALQRGVDVRDEAAVTRSGQRRSRLMSRPLQRWTGAPAMSWSRESISPGRCAAPKWTRTCLSSPPIRGVRQALSQQQRRIGQRGRVVMVGRDIGTVVLPEADLKIYLDASAEERARRRFNEIIARGEQADFNEILSKVRDRDRDRFDPCGCPPASSRGCDHH